MTTANSIEELLKDPSKVKGGKKATPVKDKGSKKIKDKKQKDVLERKMEDIKINEAERKAKASAQASKTPYIDLIGMAISPETLTLISEEDSKKYNVLSFLFIGDEIRIGAVDPTKKAVKELIKQTGERNRAKVEAYQISQHSYDVITKLYDKIPVYKKAPKGVQISQKDLDKYAELSKDFDKINDEVNKLKDANMTDLVSLIIAAALSSGSSDIHIEAEEKDVKFRLRIDGILHDAAEIDKSSWKRLISRMKQLSGY